MLLEWKNEPLKKKKIKSQLGESFVLELTL